MDLESDTAVSFKRWLSDHGGGFHPQTIFTQASAGLGLIAREDVPADQEIVSCPFDLAITGPTSQATLSSLLDLKDASPNLSCRQWICTYIVLHWIIGKDSESSRHLRHFPYLQLLPPQGDLLTAVYFTQEELECFRGTNLYGACNDRLRDWQTEWAHCREIVSQSKPDWGIQFEWTLYLAASTYLSSRAFPSTVLSDNPQLPNTDSELSSSEPVLLPGVDILNHARAQPVSWITYNDPSGVDEQTFVKRVAIVPHRPISAGQEIFNNYGPKPNSELILGYGFTLPNNPDDTILLKVGGIEGRKWSIARDAKGVQGLWDEILSAMGGDAEAEDDYEAILDASGALQDMVSTLVEKLPAPNAAAGRANVRPQVTRMFEHYVEGKRGFLADCQKEQEAVELARSQGIDLVLEET